MTEIAYGSERKGPSSEQQKVILEKAKERIPEPVYTLLLDYIVKTLEANYMHLDGCTSTEVAICAILLYLTEGKSQRVFRKFFPFPRIENSTVQLIQTQPKKTCMDTPKAL